MREKLRDSRGETLVEVLASVLICALAITLLVGAVTVSANINRQAQEADLEYYKALSRAEAQKEEERLGTLLGVGVHSGLDISVINDQTNPNRKRLNVYLYGNERLLSYAAAPETGGGP